MVRHPFSRSGSPHILCYGVWQLSRWRWRFDALARGFVAAPVQVDRWHSYGRKDMDR